MPIHTHTYRVFFASPARDTQGHRQQVDAFVARLNEESHVRNSGVRIELLMADAGHPVVITAKGGGQSDVIQKLGRIEEVDLCIAVFCNTMGSFMQRDPWGSPPGADRCWYHTEWEVHEALQADVPTWIFRDRWEADTDVDERMEDEHLKAQLAVVEFTKSLETMRTPSCPAGVKLNKVKLGPERFGQHLQTMLRDWLATMAKEKVPAASPAPQPPTPASEPLSTTQQQLLALLAQPGSKPPDALLEDVLTAPVRGWAGHLLRRYVYWARGAGGRLERDFVNLLLMKDRLPPTADERQRLMLQEGPRFVPDVVGGREGPVNDLATLLEESAGAWLLQGDPGCGKSTLLQHHELSCARTAALLLQQGVPPDDAEVAFYVRLSDYAEAEGSPTEWLARQWRAQAPEPLPPWEVACQRWRIRVLADGLNEIRAEDSAGQARAMRRWGTWAAGLAGSGRLLPPVFTVRTLELGDGIAAAGLRLRHVSVALWSDEQIERFCQQRGQHDVWQALSEPSHSAIRGLCALPFNLVAQCELHAATGKVATNRVELLSGVVWLRVEAEDALGASGKLAAPGLLGPTDRQRLASRAWLRDPASLPAQGWLVRGLEGHALDVHQQGVSISFTERELRRSFDALVASATDDDEDDDRPEPPTAAQWLAALKALDLMGLSSLGDDEQARRLRYSHQLWQELFAARGLRQRCRGGHGHAESLADLPGLQPEAPADLQTVLASLGPADPLPPAPGTRWEEPVKMSAQLMREPLPLLRAVQQRNPCLAARAAAGVRARLESHADGRQWLQTLRQQLLRSSRDPAVELRLRIEAGLALGEVGDPRYREGKGPEGHRYLLPDDAHWVPFAARTWRLGTEREFAEYTNESPCVEVPLPAFAMAFAPVTNAEFRCFVDAGGYDDSRWWQGGQARAWQLGELRNAAGIAWYEEWRAAWREDAQTAIERYGCSAVTAKEIAALAAQDDDEWQRTLDKEFGAKKRRQPNTYGDPYLSAPAQAVSGLSWYEAMAYACWLSHQSGRPLNLPTEAQWEAAARGADSRRWPWGDEEPLDFQINAVRTHLHRTTPVGVFVDSDSPDGLVDLAGNVWEWTRSAYTDEMDAVQLCIESGDQDALRSARGGSCDDHFDRCRTGFRLSAVADPHSYDLGFRLVCCPTQSPEP